MGTASGLEGQPDPDTELEAWARFVTTNEYVIGHLFGSILGLICLIFGVFALGVYLATSRAGRMGLWAMLLTVLGSALFLPLAGISTFAVPEDMMGQGGMMGGGWGIFGVIGMLFPLLFFGGLIALIVWAVTQLGSGGHTATGGHASGSAGGVHEQSAEETLRQRFARGEIDADEYEQRNRVLREKSLAAHR